MTRHVLEHDWFPAPLPENVAIDERSYLYSAFALVHATSRRACQLRIGRDSGVYIETFFDLGPDGEVSIGDYCTIAGPIFSTNSRIEIGNYVLVSREVVFADDEWSLPPPPQALPPTSARTAPAAAPIIIGDDCWIGSRAVILGGARLGRGVIVGAGAVVRSEIPDYAIVAGNPATIVGWARPVPSPARHPSSGDT